MKLPFKKESPIETEMRELSEAWVREELDSVERTELVNRYMELANFQLEQDCSGWSMALLRHGCSARRRLSVWPSRP